MSRDDLPPEAEVVIVGAGIVGVCAALFLARDGRETLLLERGAPFGDASGLNAGTLSLQVKTPRTWDLSRLGLTLWARLAGELEEDLGFTRCGGLRIALNDDELARLRESVRSQCAHGLQVSLLEGAALREQAPWLGPGIRAAGRCADDAYASPLLAGPALLRGAVAQGASVFAECAVAYIQTDGPGYRLHTARGQVRCRHLILAAGAATGDLAAMLGISLPVLADLNMLHVTEPVAPIMDGILTHVGGVLSLKQYPNGTCLIGGGWQGRGDADNQAIHHENLHHNLAIAARAVPAIKGARLVRSWTGREALVPDALPVVGEVPGRAGVHIAACARGGYTIGPAQAFIVSEQIAGRSAPLDVAPFSPGRLL